MFAPTLDQALKLLADACYPEDIFVQLGDTPKVVFRKLRSVLHEDFVPAEKKDVARELFHKLHLAWTLTEELIASKSFGNKIRKIDSFSTQTTATHTAAFFVKSKKGTYSDLALHCEGKVAHVYFGTDGLGKKVVVKIANNPICNQFLENESAHILMMRKEFPNSENGRYFPTLLDAFFISQSGDRLAVNVFEYLEGYYVLSDVIRMFSDAKKSIDVKSVAWMYNRILETLSHSGPLAIVHGGIHPDNILLHPESHRIVATGWSSSVKVPKKVPYANDAYMFMYPEEVIGDKSKRKAFLSTDLYMAACTVWHTAGGDVVKRTLPSNIPGEIRAFLNARLTSDVRLRDAVAIQQRDRFSGVLKALYGPAKFHNFVLPISRR
jgi:hypothetical protein